MRKEHEKQTVDRLDLCRAPGRTGIGVAQIVDDPSVSLYQTQGIRESDEGVRARESLESVRDIPSVYVRAARAVPAVPRPQGRATPPLIADAA
jgi:hypothetical protein